MFHTLPDPVGQFSFVSRVYFAWRSPACDNEPSEIKCSPTMLNNVLHFIISIVFSLFGIALLVRAWIYAIRLHPFNPYSQGVLRLSNWLIQTQIGRASCRERVYQNV